jgi:hypothetical protein
MGVVAGEYKPRRRNWALCKLTCATPLRALVPPPPRPSRWGQKRAELQTEIHLIVMHGQAMRPGSMFTEKTSEQRAGSSWTQLDSEMQWSRK